MGEPKEKGDAGDWFVCNGGHGGVHIRNSECMENPPCVDLGEEWKLWEPITHKETAPDNHALEVEVITHEGKLLGPMPASKACWVLSGADTVQYYRIIKEKQQEKKEFSEADTAKDFLNSLMDSDAPGWVLAPSAAAWKFGIKRMVKNMRSWPIESKWLDDNGYVFEWEKPARPVHEIGNHYRHKSGDEYILCAPSFGKIVLICLKNGSRWHRTVVMPDTHLTEAEWKAVTAEQGADFTLIKKETK